MNGVKTNTRLAALLAATIALTTAPGAQAQTNDLLHDAIEQTRVEQSATLSRAEEAAFGPAVTTFSASGTTAAPGANGAYVGINVDGSGLFVNRAYVNYFSGLKTGNATVGDMELSWYEGGRRRAVTSGPDSGYIRATRRWDFGRNIDRGPMCGRVKIEGKWSNYVCVDIKP